MANQAAGNLNTVTRSYAYDNPSYLTRQSSSLGTIAGSGGASTTKFIAFTQMTVWGVSFFPITALGSSTYTVNGVSTTSAMSAYAVFVANTNTTGTAVTLATTTVGGASTGPFYIGGTGAAGTNVNVPGVGAIAGGYWRYAINTLGGTNTTLAWGTTTYSSGYPGGGAAGIGGLYMNPGDTFYVVAGTDATGTSSHILEYSIGAPTGVLMA
jgi:hypothetical protein